MNKLNRIIIIIILLTSVTVLKLRYNTVNRVIDGDTYIINNTKVRLFGVDAPELKQEFGLEAKEFVEHLILHKRVLVVLKSKDRYNRQVAEIYINGSNLAYILLENGMVWNYYQFSKSNLMESKQQFAKYNKIGLWKYDAINPKEFRRKH